MANLDVGMKCIKYMLFTSNFMFVMIGFLLISIGTTVGAIYRDFELFMEDHFFSPATLLIVIGVVIFFVSMFGCVGAIKESTCLVNMYALCLLIILILEISAAIAAYALRRDISYYIEENMNTSMKDYGNDEFTTYSWDFLQSRFQCCGISDANDWENYIKDVPESCCAKENCVIIYENGCLDRLTYIVSELSILIGTGGVCVAIVQFLGIIFASMLAKSIRRIKTEEEIKRQENRQRLYAQLAAGRKDEKPTPVIYTPTE